MGGGKECRYKCTSLKETSWKFTVELFNYSINQILAQFHPFWNSFRQSVNLSTKKKIKTRNSLKDPVRLPGLRSTGNRFFVDEQHRSAKVGIVPRLSRYLHDAHNCPGFWAVDWTGAFARERVECQSLTSGMCTHTAQSPNSCPMHTHINLHSV